MTCPYNFVPPPPPPLVVARLHPHRRHGAGVKGDRSHAGFRLRRGVCEREGRVTGITVVPIVALTSVPKVKEPNGVALHCCAVVVEHSATLHEMHGMQSIHGLDFCFCFEKLLLCPLEYRSSRKHKMVCEDVVLRECCRRPNPRHGKLVVIIILKDPSSEYDPKLQVRYCYTW